MSLNLKEIIIVVRSEVLSEHDVAVMVEPRSSVQQFEFRLSDESPYYRSGFGVHRGRSRPMVPESWAAATSIETGVLDELRSRGVEKFQHGLDSK
jgi:hypothetical protein